MDFTANYLVINYMLQQNLFGSALPCDIFAGLIIGALAAGFIYYLLRKISPKMFTKEEAK